MILGYQNIDRLNYQKLSKIKAVTFLFLSITYLQGLYIYRDVYFWLYLIKYEYKIFKIYGSVAIQCYF